MPCKVHGDDEEHLGCDVQTDGVQPVSWIETDNGDIRRGVPEAGASGTHRAQRLPLGSRLDKKL